MLIKSKVKGLKQEQRGREREQESGAIAEEEER